MLPTRCGHRTQEFTEARNVALEAGSGADGAFGDGLEYVGFYYTMDDLPAHIPTENFRGRTTARARAVITEAERKKVMITR